MEPLTRLAASDSICCEDDGNDVVEVPLLLNGWQVSALETAARDRGQTAGEMVRDLLREFLARQTGEFSQQSSRPF